MKFQYVVFSVTLFCGVAAAQESCSSYPYREGMNIESTAVGPKIVATGSASVSFDDIDSIKDARTEAEVEAKGIIVKFLKEYIKDETKIEKIVDESKVTTAEGRKASRTELVRRVRKLENSAQRMMTGIQVLGSCYTSAREVRVTVGLKTETIAMAERLANSVDKSISRQSDAVGAGSNSGKVGGNTSSAMSKDGVIEPHRNVDGWSDSDAVRKF